VFQQAQNMGPEGFF